MLGALEIIVIAVILGVLLLLHARTRAGPLVVYVSVGVLLLMLIVAMRVIRSLVGVVILLAVICMILSWRVVRSWQSAPVERHT